MEHKLVPVSAALTREQIAEFREKAFRLLYAHGSQYENVDALCDMALRYRDLLEQEPCAWQIWLYEPVDTFHNKDEAIVEFQRRSKLYPEKNRVLKALIAAPIRQKER